MSVSPGNVIKLENVEPGVTRIIPEQESKSSGFANILNLLGVIISVALTPIIGPETVFGTIAVESAAIGIDLGLQAASAKIEGRSLDSFSIAFSLLGGAGAAFSTIKAAKTISKASETIKSIGETAAQSGLNALQTQVLAENAQKVITEKLSAKAVSQQLIRAGLTEREAVEQLTKISNIAANNGLRLGRFADEIAFINQETKIFSQLNGVAEKFGFSLDDVFATLEKSGIDVVGVKSTDQLVKTIRSSEKAVENLRGSNLLTELEGALERDLDTTLFTRVLNAKNAEKAAVKVNKLLSLSNPNTLITEITNKIFDPLKDRVFSKIYEPLKKRTQQKLKHLLRQDLVRKQNTKNGVYPAFGSSFINYIRAIPLGKSEYKAAVVFRKWGYKPVVITPTVSLQFIIGWSESSSPGRIYHQFRREFGGPKGQFSGNDVDVGFKANTAEIFNLLGFIPDKYISLGVSLISNIAIARSVVSTNAWSDFFEQPGLFIRRPLENKMLDVAGGQFATATRDQIAGNRGAMQNYFQGRIQQNVESRESAFRASSKGGRGKLDAVKSVGGIIK